MKNNKFLKSVSKLWILLLSLVVVTTSCDNEFNDPEALHNRNAEPPVITSVVEARENKAVTEGVLENFYYIKGKNLASVKSIKYNGYEAGYNPVYVTDNLIISSIPEEAPYLNQANKLRVETEYGVTEYNFSLLTITEFVEETVDGENLIYIYGGDFTNVARVTFVSGSEELGNLDVKEADIKEVTQERVTVVVPSGVIQAFINVETDSGAVVVSESYGFNYPIFIDDIVEDWAIEGWSNGGTLSTEQFLGQASIKADIQGWGGLSINTIDWDQNLGADPGEYSKLVFKVYATASNQRLIFGINSGAADGVHWEDNNNVLQISNPDFGWEPGDWTQIEIPISQIFPGEKPNSIYRIYFQIEQGTFYIDDMGFLE